MIEQKELLKQAVDVIEALFYGYEELDREKVILTVEKIEKELAKPEATKREPLSNKQMQNVLDEWLKIPTYSAPIDLIRLTEKAHGIGE